MSKKKIMVVNENSGEIENEICFTGGYNISVTDYETNGKIRNLRKIDNARYNDKLWIMNYRYEGIAKLLIEKFEELNHIDIETILFLEDLNWTKKANTSRKSSWIAKVNKVNSQLNFMCGYEFIITTRKYYTEQMSREQLVAMIYHELKHIDKFGDIEMHDIEDWENMIVSLGHDWATTQEDIADILAEGFEWGQFGNTQITMNQYLETNVIPMQKAKQL